MENILVLTFLSCLSCVLGNSTYYSSYYGFTLTSTQVAAYTANNTLANCTTLVTTCDSTEGRRIDGTCNNLNYPAFGASHTPYCRVAAAEYNKTSSTVFDPRLTVSGKALPGARKVRTALVAEGRVEDANLTSLINHLSVIFFTDITNTRDTTNYLSWRPHCCAASGANDSACFPNPVLATDFVHRFSSVRCLNMTRPLSFQTSGCLPNTTTPARIVDATPAFDLSPIYGNVEEPARRTNSSGKLVTVTTANNITFPDTSTINLLLGINFFGIILFWRLHNHIATQLAAVNSSWTDDELFYKARDINIAIATQMFYYEVMGTLLGTDNLIADGILSDCTTEFRDVYDETVKIQISVEYSIAMRWMHTMQEGTIKAYATNGTYLYSTPVVGLTSNTNYLKENDTMVYVTQGFFRQGAGNTKDYMADPDIVQKGLSSLQYANDIMTNDLAKNRLAGLKSYVYYREYCFGDNITSFDNLIDIIDPERIEILKDMYEDVSDVDLLSGLWLEIPKEGSYVPPTFYCIVVDQLNRTLVSDRHWYERSERPNAFTSDQLQEIRKATAARMLCDIGDNVTMIQPRALELPSDDNVIVSCDDIPAIDFSVFLNSTDYDYDYND